MKTIRRRVCVIALTWIACAPSAFGQIVPADADHRDYWSDWFERVDRTQAAQPHWMTPLATTTPRLEEEWRSDVFVMPRPDGTVDNIGGGKGPSVIPFERVEIIVSPPPYLHHRDAPSTDGFGDAGMLVKYRLVAANEHRGNLKGALIQRRPCVEWDDV